MQNNESILMPIFIKLSNKIKNNEQPEIIAANIVGLDPKQPVLTFVNNNNSVIKKTNTKYANLELNWYASQDLNCAMVSDVAKIWKKCSDENGFVNSNYGYLIYNENNYLQYENCIKQLKSDINTRRAIMIYNRPSMQYDYKSKNDFICTMYNMFMIRDNKLYSIYNMRSNDLIYGFFNDFYWACTVYMQTYSELLLTYPNLEIGEIIWQACSLHVYPKHYDLVHKIAEEGRC